MKGYKIGELPRDFNLVGCKLGRQYIISGWSRGFWVVDNYEDYKSGKQAKTEPVFFKDFEEIKNWEIEIPLGKDFSLTKKIK